MSALLSVFRALGARFNAWLERERAYAELSALDDRALADLGLRRADIPFIVFDRGRSDVVLAEGQIEAANRNGRLRAA